jgi:hypothetical protein
MPKGVPGTSGPNRKQGSVSVNINLWNQIHARSQASGKPMVWWVEMLINEGFNSPRVKETEAILVEAQKHVEAVRRTLENLPVSSETKELADKIEQEGKEKVEAIAGEHSEVQPETEAGKQPEAPAAAPVTEAAANNHKGGKGKKAA